MSDKISCAVEEIRSRWNKTKDYINSHIDKNGKSVIINMDGKKNRSHEKAKSTGQSGWREQDHPRDENGQFTTGSSASNGGSEKEEVKEESKAEPTKESKPKMSDAERKNVEGRIVDASDSLKDKRGVDENGELKCRYKPKIENFAKEGFGVMKPNKDKVEIKKNGKNEKFSGFSNMRMFDKHYVDHVCAEGAMGDITQEEYFNKAQELFQKPVNGDIDGAVMNENGIQYVVRYNKKTGEFVKGVPGGVLKTYMQLKVDIGKGEVDFNKAEEYWKREKKKCEDSMNEVQ